MILCGGSDGKVKPNTSFSMYTESFPREPLKVLNIHNVNETLLGPSKMANSYLVSCFRASFFSIFFSIFVLINSDLFFFSLLKMEVMLNLVLG